MNRAGARRAEILDRLADFVLAEGLVSASLRPLAQAAGLSDRMLLYYFADKSAVLSATLETVVARLTLGMERLPAEPRPAEALWRDLLAFSMDPEVWPYLRLWLEIAVLAARGDPFWRARGEAIGLGFLDWVVARLDGPSVEVRRIEAARLLARLDGVVVLRAVGLDGAVPGAFTELPGAG